MNALEKQIYQLNTNILNLCPNIYSKSYTIKNGTKKKYIPWLRKSKRTVLRKTLQAQSPAPQSVPVPVLLFCTAPNNFLKPESEAPLVRGAKPLRGAPPLPRLSPPRPADSPGCAAGPPAPCDSTAVPRSRAGICPPRGSFQPEFRGSDTRMSRARGMYVPHNTLANKFSRDLQISRHHYRFVRVVRDGKTTEA